MTGRNKDDSQRLEAWLASAPRVGASPAFCDRVMRAIEARPLPWRVRLKQMLFTPHTVRWNLAGATAIVLMVSSISAILGSYLGRVSDPAPLASAVPAAERVVTVRFQVALPQARQVRLAGDFTQWQPRVPLKRNSDGTWAAEIRLPPGDHEYIFVVDGERWISDPRAHRYRDDGFGNRNAVLTVPSV